MEPVLGKEKILLLERNHLGSGERVGFVCDFRTIWGLSKAAQGAGEEQEEWPLSSALPCRFYHYGPLSVLWGPGLEQILILSDVLVTCTWALTHLWLIYLFFSDQ